MDQSEFKKLFEQTRSLAPSDRQEFLAALDPAVRAKVDLLLADDLRKDEQPSDADLAITETGQHHVAVGGSKTAPLEENGDPLTEVGPFKILQPIGRGGMGQVFMAEQTAPVKRRVALKVIKTDTPTKEILARFEAERQALAMMDHHNIAKVLDAGVTEDGRPYFAMELVKGVPITAYCDQNKLAPEERLALFVQTCRAIQHAHMKGIIHRDLKPSNVLVTLYDGRPVAKVIDFGLAKAMQEQTQLTNRTLFTQYGQVVGTLAYMSPEQAEMNTLDVDTRTDVYSLGVILYELLTGSTPITREKIKSEAFDRILAMIREVEAPRPSQRLSDSGEQITGISEQRKTEPRRLSLILKGDLDWITVKALEKDRTRRYGSPAELADDVERFLTHEAIQARPPSFRYQLRKTLRKHKGTFAAAAGVFGVLLAGLLGTGLMWFRAAEAERKATAETGKTQNALLEMTKQRDRADKESARANSLAQKRADTISQLEDNLYVSRLKEAQAALEAGDYETAQRLLDVDLPSVGETDRRCFVWYYLQQQMQTAHPDVYLRPGADEHARLIRNASGTRVIVLSRFEFQVIRTSDMHVLFEASRGELSDACFLNDNRIAVATGNGSRNSRSRGRYKHRGVWIYDLDLPATGAREVVMPKEAAGIDGTLAVGVCVAASPNGETLACGLSDGRIALWNVLEQKLIGTPTPVDHGTGAKARDYVRLKFSPDGKFLVSLRYSKGIDVWDTEEMAAKNTYRYGSDEWQFYRDRDFAQKTWLTDRAAIAVSSDGKLFAMSGNPGSLQAYTFDGQTTLMRPLPNAIGTLDFIPGTHTLVSGSLDHTIRMWDADSGEELTQIGSHRAAVGGVVALPSGKELLSFGEDNRIRKWRLPETQDTSALPNTNVVYSIRFQPESNNLVVSGWPVGNYGAGYFDLKTGQRTSLEAYQDIYTRVHQVDVTPDGDLLATSTTESKAIELWDRDFNRVQRFESLTGEYRAERTSTISLHPTGRMIAGRVGGKTRVWLTTTGKEVATVPGFSRFTPDGKLLVSSDSKVVLRTVTDESLGPGIETSLPPVRLLRFSRDSQLMAGSLRDEPTEFVVVDTKTQSVLFRGTGHYEAIMDLAFCPDGLTLASVGGDGRIILWDLKTGRSKAELKGHNGAVNCADFSPDGSMLATGGNDYMVRLWRAPLASARPHRTTLTELDRTSFESRRVRATDLRDITYENEKIIDFTKPNVASQLIRRPLEDNGEFTEDGLRVTPTRGEASDAAIELNLSGDFAITVALDELELPEPGAHGATARLSIDFHNEIAESFALFLKRNPGHSTELLRVHQHTPKDSFDRLRDLQVFPQVNIQGPQQLRMVRKRDRIHFLYRPSGSDAFRVVDSRRVLSANTDRAHVLVTASAWGGAAPPSVVWKKLEVRWNHDEDAVARSESEAANRAATVRMLNSAEFAQTKTIDLSQRSALEKLAVRNLDEPHWNFAESGLRLDLGEETGFRLLKIPSEVAGDFDVVGTVARAEIPQQGFHNDFLRFSVGFNNEQVVFVDSKRTEDMSANHMVCGRSGEVGAEFRFSESLDRLPPGTQLKLARRKDKVYCLFRLKADDEWRLICDKFIGREAELGNIGLAICSNPDTKSPVVEWRELQVRTSQLAGAAEESDKSQ